VQALAKERKVSLTYMDKTTGKRKYYKKNKLVEFITKLEINKLKNRTQK